MKSFKQLYPVILGIFLAVFLFSGYSCEFSTEKEETQTLDLVFAMDVAEGLAEPIDVRDEIEEGVDFYLYFWSNQKFGKDEVTITIYGIDESTGEIAALDVSTFDVDPENDTMAIALPMPSGTYTFEIDFGDGLSVSKEVYIYPSE